MAIFVPINEKIEHLEKELAELKRQIEEKKPIEKKYAQEPEWGYKAELTEEFLSQTMVLNGIKYHRHKHGGGWVSEKAKVDESVWVGSLAIIHNGVIKDQAVITDMAVVDCSGLQTGADSNISGLARVSGSAWVSDSARVYGLARVSGNGYLKRNTNENIELKNGECVE